MKSGGWTLVGKISGRVGNIYNTWLVQNVNINLLKSTSMNSRTEYASLDARLLAVRHSSAIMFSSSDNPSGVGNKWVRWEWTGKGESSWNKPSDCEGMEWADEGKTGYWDKGVLICTWRFLLCNGKYQG